jgi:hypothetical protein
MRFLWLRRNSFVFDRGWESLDQVLNKVKGVRQELETTATERHVLGMLSIPRLSSNWSRPPVGTLKLNWDAALSPELRRMGTGVVVRNDRGDVVAAMRSVCRFLWTQRWPKLLQCGRLSSFVSIKSGSK